MIVARMVGGGRETVKGDIDAARLRTVRIA
jgi:hypothetical protein